MDFGNSQQEKKTVHLKNALLSVREQIKFIEKDRPKDSFEKKLILLDSLVNRKVTTSVVRVIKKDPELQTCLQDIVRIHREIGLEMECRITEQILSGFFSWEVISHFHYYSNYMLLAREEGTYAELGEGDEVTFLGSGPFPLTLILLHRLFSIKGLGIERDEKRAEISRKVLKKLELDRKITIVTADEGSLPIVQKSKLIMVSAFAEPKRKIFQKLAQIIRPNALLSYRIYEKGMRALFSEESVDIKSEESVDIKDDIVFQEVKRIPPKGPVNNTIIFLRKKN